MASSIYKDFKFVSIFFRSCLIALGTVASQTAYNVLAFDCPCSKSRNYLYGLVVISVPALVFFLVVIMLNRSTWDLISECRLRKCRKLLGHTAFALLETIIGEAFVAPLTWVTISLLQGRVYTCAFSEFVDPQTIKEFPKGHGSAVMAKLTCKESVPEELQRFLEPVERRLKYESQLIGWLLVAGMALMVFLHLCLKRCSSPIGYLQESYWSEYRSSEKTLFQNTAAAHARILAAQNVKSFFGFVALDKEEEEQLAEQKNIAPVCSTNWDRVTGVHLYREKNGLPLYSRLDKWSSDCYGMEKEV
ncbi:LOW QUALITY PROTEIN: calcium homeostasis modulator protein 2-like [Neosynchiropus ocellatus]